MGFEDYSFEPGAPYDFLENIECIQMPDESAHFMIHDLSPVRFAQYVDWVNHQETDEFSDVGDKIMHSYFARDQMFTPREMMFAWDFFSNDYAHSMECADKCFDIFQDKSVKSVDGKHLFGVLLNRAYDDTFRGSIFGNALENENFWDSDECLENLLCAKEGLAVSYEYPNLPYMLCYDVVSMRQEMKDAIAEEEYERAAQIKEGLVELVKDNWE